MNPIKFSPAVSLGFRLTTVVAGLIIAAAQTSPEHFGGAALAGNVVFWGSLGVSILNAVFASGGTGSQPSLTVLGKVQ